MKVRPKYRGFSNFFHAFLLVAELKRLRLQCEAKQAIIEAQQSKIEGTAAIVYCLQAAELQYFNQN